MMPRVMGLETEYATAWQGPNPPPPLAVFQTIAKQVLRRFASEAQVGTSLFLPNGGRLYFDDEAQAPGCGLIEWATPECRSAVEATIYDLAGQQLLAEAIPPAEAELGGRLTLLKNNRNAKGHTYGCHENYLTPRFHPCLADEAGFFQFIVRTLSPFLVTRQIFCGAGHVGPYCHSLTPRFGYQLSQRSDFLTSLVSEDARRYKPVINTRDEAHADKRQYRRLHILAGDSNLSAWCTFMKLATTQLVLHLAEELTLDVDLVLCDPVMALRTISYNGCHAEVAVLENGYERRLSALRIQELYLEAVQSSSGTFEEIERAVLREWQEALCCLTRDPVALADRVDWITKMVLVSEERADRHADWDDISLTEIDFRYHDIDPRSGIFEVLLREGAVHFGPLAETFSRERVQRAIMSPPMDTRARLRGEYIASCWKEGKEPQASWTEMIVEGQSVRLDDPLACSFSGGQQSRQSSGVPNVEWSDVNVGQTVQT